MTEDGSIVINTKIRTDGIKAGTAEIEAGVHRAADRVNTLGSNVKKTLNNQIDSFVKLNDEYSTQEQKVESLRQKVAAYANQRIPTTEYKEITAQIEQAQEKLNRLNDAKERFGATGGKVNSTSYKKMQYDIEDLANVIKYAKSELDDLEASGKAFISGVNTKEAQADMEKLTAVEKKLSDMQKQLHTSYQSIADTYNSYLNKLLENERKNERKIAEINGKLEETRAKEVEAAVEANRLKAIGDNAKVGSKRIVNLNSELERLQARQNELKSAGIGSGYKEFDSNTRRIAKINETLIINRLVWDTAQWAGSLNFYPLLNSIKNLFESMSPLIEAIGSFLERLYTNVILPMLKFLIENGLPFLINLLTLHRAQLFRPEIRF